MKELSVFVPLTTASYRGGYMGANKNKVSKKFYAVVLSFSFLWLLFMRFMPVFFDQEAQLDSYWNDFIVRLPNKLASVNIFSDKYNDTFLFGKYINKTANPKITVTALDDYTLSRYGWPIKRRYYGELVEKLNRLGVKSIGTDVLLFEPDRDNPANDLRYVEAVKKAGNVVNLIGVDQYTWEITQPIKGLAGASSYIAYPNVDIALDPDGYVRKYWPFYKPRPAENGAYEYFTYGRTGIKNLRCAKACGNVKIASLGMAVYADYSGKSMAELEMAYDGINILNYRYPFKRKLHPGWHKEDLKSTLSSYRHLSAADVLEGKLSQEEKDALKGGVTLIGATALGAFDHVPNPFMALYPGVEVHATFIDNALGNDFRKNMGEFYVAMLILALPWVPVMMRRFSLKAMVAVSVSTMAVLAVMDVVLFSNLVVMPFISVMGAFFIPFAYITVDKGLAEGREKKWIKNTFGQYLSPKVVEIITRDPSKLTLGGEKRDMTVFFLDIAGFTSMSEKLSPEQLTALLNKYLSGLTDVILKYDGVVDKFIGDCIMAFWNAPLDQKDHRRLACLAAVDCTVELARLNGELDDSAIKPSFRIGLNSGPMVVGNMGSSTRFSYTVLGDSVNLASRLEGANKFFHSRIMVSEDTYEGAADAVDARCLGRVRVVGKAIPVKVYELLAHKGKLDAVRTKVLAAYNAGFEDFHKGGFAEAARAFKTALAADPNDGPSAFYLGLAEKYSAGGAPGGWDGTFNLTSK